MDDILLAGYYGEKNIGDDALLAASAWGCQQILKAKKIHVTATELPSITKHIRNVRPVYVAEERIKSDNLLRLYHRALTSKHIIFGGGSVFHSTEKLTRDSDLVDMCRGESVALGVSFGPFRDSGAELASKKLIERLAYIGCRDKQSYELVKDLVPYANVELTFDLAPLLLSMGHFDRTSSTRKGIGLALCHYERYIGGNYEIERKRVEKVIQAIQQLSDEIEEIVLFDFNNHPIFGDVELNKEVLNRLGTTIPISYIRYKDDPFKVLVEISRVKGLIGMRLHSAVFGYLTETPTIIFSYHPKCLGWAEQIGSDPSFTVDSTNFETDELIHAIIRLLNNEYSYPTLSLEKAKERSLKNLEGAKCVLYP
ncbi:polysaccharide pyruvyl transferase family protein [Alkalihalobacterium alkalicellulosilyticum]|uniref:polysaccharide pyruvyl transferase family protein n=1 Tax=Alkalihalobacterium alkalicellulosilyticum TaxID=1912214 RepID=UPI000996A49A|nr:polysaccharide pyruvyl transferase family protein [Bacillus alkalicellulosilyticus]